MQNYINCNQNQRQIATFEDTDKQKIKLMYQIGQALSENTELQQGTYLTLMYLAMLKKEPIALPF